MGKLSNKSGADTLFTDKDGKAIHVHDYVKDADGNRYYINSYCQAVPDGDDAPAVELDRLIKTTEVSVMGIEELLDMKKPVEHKRRGGRHKKEDPAKPSTDEAQAEDARMAMEEAARKADEKALAEAAEKAKAEAAEAAKEGMRDLHPVTEEMLLGLIPDDVLANELRRRGYTLCAVRPALIEL